MRSEDMRNQEKVTLSAAGVGCAVNLLLGTLFGFVGAGVGYAFMPTLPPGGYYGAIGDALLALLIWCVPGLVIGFLSAPFIAGRVARWINNHQH